eukprot:TRINITY_DN2250_c0_g1_i5.p1 TRINITY_DN2250_c0_g1~~TRINITY_DN2250_c0_g1_i5.p1  ORF type:complete len:779 (-),score=237.06 TRINITY_DN2250_c0_g1_i5:20-2245(-)
MWRSIITRNSLRRRPSYPYYLDVLIPSSSSTSSSTSSFLMARHPREINTNKTPSSFAPPFLFRTFSSTPDSTNHSIPSDSSSSSSSSTTSSASNHGAQPSTSETVSGNAVKHDFQTETQKLLDIVARSLYTDKEVFVRELISNASDAMEKVRHVQVTGKSIIDPDIPFEINIFTNEEEKTLIIQDTGIGMNQSELIQNLGRIGHSGSLEFLKQTGAGGEDKSAIIGQFGVGFYSTFMVGNRVRVYSRSAIPPPPPSSSSPSYMWESDGTGQYTIAEASGVVRGTKIIINLRDDCSYFSDRKTIENIIKKYSNFVGFPIKLNGERVNTVRPIWTIPKDKVTEDEHKEFYQFIARAYDTPVYRLHYSTDSPIHIRGLFYLPSQHMEKFGMGRLEPGVSLFSRKVMIQAKAKGILPDWLRFVKGVVDSEDIPLNISREHMQDSSLIQKLNSVLTKRIMKFIEGEAKRDPDTYLKWYKEFGTFLKEGICTDFKWKEEISKCLRFETSAKEEGEMTSLEEYVSRMQEGQREIYYLNVPAREYAVNSPYYEGFKAKNLEVLFLYTNLDDFVMQNLNDYGGKTLASIESTKVDVDAEKPATPSNDNSLSEQEVDQLCSWLRTTLSSRVTIVRETKRLHNSPAIITDHETASYRRMMRHMDPTRVPQLPKQQLEINSSHPIIIKLFKQRQTHPVIAKEVAEQVMDNALVAAGLVDDSRSMLPRLNTLLEVALDSPHDLPPPPSSSKNEE